MTISSTVAYERLDEMFSQLEKSWPTTLNSIIEKCKTNRFKDCRTFFVYTFTKWNYDGAQPEYRVIHHVVKAMPDPFYGTVCQRIYPNEGKSEIVWSLPHKEGLKNYEPGKMFYNEVIWNSMQRKKEGILDKMQEEYNQTLSL